VAELGSLGVVEIYASTSIHRSRDPRSAVFWSSQVHRVVLVFFRRAVLALFSLEFDLCGLPAVPRAKREVPHRCFSASLHNLGCLRRHYRRYSFCCWYEIQDLIDEADA
jgi:hypothetical protein